jgi:hypothetical protein
MGHAGFFHAQWTLILRHLPGSRRNLTELLRRADQGVPIASVNWTVAEYLPYWLSEVVREDRRPKTYQGYEGVVRCISSLDWARSG